MMPRPASTPRLLLASAIALSTFSATLSLAQISLDPNAPPPAPETQPVSPPMTSPVPPPATAPATRPSGPAVTTLPSADEVLQQLLLERNHPSEVAPAATGRDPNAEATGLRMPEGHPINQRVGHLVKDEKTGAELFVFEPAANQPVIAPMPIIPCSHLAVMEDASDYGAKPVRFKINAEVTQYRGRNYLYLGVGGMGGAGAGSASGGTREPAQPIIDPVAPNAPPPVRLHEGNSIFQRVGRLVKDDKTSVEVFTFDSDGRQMYDAPLGIVPCHFLEVMENSSDFGAKPVRFIITAEITQYRGKNFLYIRSLRILQDHSQGLGG